MGQYGRGQHPNSRANLKAMQGKGITPENARAMQSLSTEAFRKNQTFKELLEKALTKEIVSVNGERASKKEVTAIQLANEMAKGNLKAIKLGVKILGELQDKVDITSSDNTLQIEIVPSRRESQSE